MSWEREYLSKRIEELKDYLKKSRKSEEVFIAEKLLELYEFQLLLMKYWE